MQLFPGSGVRKVNSIFWKASHPKWMHILRGNCQALKALNLNYPEKWVTWNTHSIVWLNRWPIIVEIHLPTVLECTLNTFCCDLHISLSYKLWWVKFAVNRFSQLLMQVIWDYIRSVQLTFFPPVMNTRCVFFFHFFFSSSGKEMCEGKHKEQVWKVIL